MVREQRNVLGKMFGDFPLLPTPIQQMSPLMIRVELKGLSWKIRDCYSWTGWTENKFSAVFASVFSVFVKSV